MGKREYEEEQNEPDCRQVHQRMVRSKTRCLKLSVRIVLPVGALHGLVSRRLLKGREGSSLFQRAQWAAYHCRRDGCRRENS
jgi:hypothetical protein